MNIVPATIDPATCSHKPPVGEKLWSGKIVKCMLCNCDIVLNPPHGKINKSKKQRRREKALASEHSAIVHTPKILRDVSAEMVTRQEQEAKNEEL